MKVKAAVCHEAKKPLVIEDVELDPPREGEVLVRWKASGVCGSDLHIIRGLAGWPMPFIPGHEGGGVIEEVGPGVTRVAVGDHVVSDLIGACGECRFCISGRPRLCEPQRERSVPDVNSRYHQNGKLVGRFGHHEIATFAEKAVLPQRAVNKIPKDVSLSEACLLGCCVLSGAGTVLNRAEALPGQRVVVFGCGGLGLAAINAAAASGAAQVIGVDRFSSKLEWAKEHGATDVVNASETDSVEAIRDLTGGLLADYAFDFTGSGEVAKQAVAGVCLGGTVVLVGVNPGIELSIPQFEIIDNEKVLTGALVGGCISDRDIKRILDLTKIGQFNLGGLVSHRFGLEDINKAFDLMIAGESKRSVIEF